MIFPGSSAGKYCVIFYLLLLSRFSHVRLCVTPWTAAYQASLSMGFSRQQISSVFTYVPSFLDSLPLGHHAAAAAAKSLQSCLTLRVLNRVPCAIQSVLLSYLFYSQNQ